MSILTIVLIIVGVIVFFGLLAFVAWLWLANKAIKTHNDIQKRIFNEFDKF